MEYEEQNQNKGGFLKYFIIILVILVALFLSQQAYLQEWGKTVVSNTQQKAGAYLSKGSNWAVDNVLPQVNDKVQSGGEVIQNGVDNSTQNISDAKETITEKISNYFTGIKNSIINPGESQDCQTSVE